MTVDFVKISPTENMTIIVTSPVPRVQQASVAEGLMAYAGVYAEQVGFLEESNRSGSCARLQMMGGEFCGNASMSLAAWLARRDGLAEGETAEYPLEVSGAEKTIVCSVRRTGGCYLGSVSMPLPVEIGECSLLPEKKLPLVRFEGIAHVIVPEKLLSGEEAQEKISEWCRALKADAMGILLMDEKGERMRPLVYVAETDSAVWERGCGSGSAAVGAFSAVKAGGDVRMEIVQPGGTIGVEVRTASGNIEEIRISGRVKIVASGEAYLD